VTAIRLATMRPVVRYAAIFWVFYELLMFLDLLMMPRFTAPVSGPWRLVAYCIVDGVFNFGMTLLILAVVDWLASRSRRRAAELAVLAVFLVATAVTMIAFDAGLKTFFDPTMRTFANTFFATVRYEFHDTVLTIAFLAALANAVRSWGADSQARIAESELRTAKTRAEMAALTANVQPALVVQALHHIGETVVHDPDRARTLIHALAGDLRELFRRDRENAPG
jgi:hypothetical protein